MAGGFEDLSFMQAAALKARLASKSAAPPLGDGVQLIMARLDEMQSRSDKLELQLACTVSSHTWLPSSLLPSSMKTLPRSLLAWLRDLH